VRDEHLQAAERGLFRDAFILFGQLAFSITMAFLSRSAALGVVGFSLLRSLFNDRLILLVIRGEGATDKHRKRTDLRGATAHGSNPLEPEFYRSGGLLTSLSLYALGCATIWFLCGRVFNGEPTIQHLAVLITGSVNLAISAASGALLYRTASAHPEGWG
jgi:hypothetical protein